MERSHKEKPFLDILRKRNDDQIWMESSVMSSSHPNHCKKNITFTLAGRICTIVENK